MLFCFFWIFFSFSFLSQQNSSNKKKLTKIYQESLDVQNVPSIEPVFFKEVLSLISIESAPILQLKRSLLLYILDAHLAKAEEKEEEEEEEEGEWVIENKPVRTPPKIPSLNLEGKCRTGTLSLSLREERSVNTNLRRGTDTARIAQTDRLIPSPPDLSSPSPSLFALSPPPSPSRTTKKSTPTTSTTPTNELTSSSSSSSCSFSSPVFKRVKDFHQGYCFLGFDSDSDSTSEPITITQKQPRGYEVIDFEEQLDQSSEKVDTKREGEGEGEGEGKEGEEEKGGVEIEEDSIGEEEEKGIEEEKRIKEEEEKRTKEEEEKRIKEEEEEKRIEEEEEKRIEEERKESLLLSSKTTVEADGYAFLDLEETKEKEKEKESSKKKEENRLVKNFSRLKKRETQLNDDGYMLNFRVSIEGEGEEEEEKEEEEKEEEEKEEEEKEEEGEEEEKEEEGEEEEEEEEDDDDDDDDHSFLTPKEKKEEKEGQSKKFYLADIKEIRNECISRSKVKRRAPPSFYGLESPRFDIEEGSVLREKKSSSRKKKKRKKAQKSVCFLFLFFCFLFFFLLFYFILLFIFLFYFILFFLFVILFYLK